MTRKTAEDKFASTGGTRMDQEKLVRLFFGASINFPQLRFNPSSPIIYTRKREGRGSFRAMSFQFS